NGKESKNGESSVRPSSGGTCQIVAAMKLRQLAARQDVARRLVAGRSHETGHARSKTVISGTSWGSLRAMSCGTNPVGTRSTVVAPLLVTAAMACQPEERVAPGVD